MLIKSIDIKDHPVLGDLHLDFTNEGGEPFSTIVLAGGNGTGKTVILETIHKLLNGTSPTTSERSYAKSSSTKTISKL